LLSITSAGNATLTGTLQATRAGLGAAVAATERLRLLSDYVPGGTENEIITFQLSASNPANFHVAIGEFPNVGGGQPDSTMFIGYNVSGDAFTKVINEPSNFIGFESHYTPNGTTVQMEQYLQYFQPNGTDYYRPIASYYNYYTTPPVLQTELQGSFIIFNDMTSLVSTPNEIARFVSSTRNMGIGTTSIDARLHVSAATAQTRLLQVGPGLVSGNHAAYINAVCDAAQTTRYACLQLAPTTAAAAFTCADVMGFYIPSWTVGAGSAITRATGAAVYLGIESASVNSAGFYYGDVPPAYTGHWSFYAGSGAAYFASTVQALRAGIGIAADGTIPLLVSATTEQERLAYSAGVYASHTVASTGVYTITQTGASLSLPKAVNVGTTLFADGIGDFGAGLTGAGQMFYDASAAMLYFYYDTTHAAGFQATSVGGLSIYPSADVTAAIKITQSAGTAVAIFDTVNKWMSLGTAVPNCKLDISVAATASNVEMIRLENPSGGGEGGHIRFTQSATTMGILKAYYVGGTDYTLEFGTMNRASTMNMTNGVVWMYGELHLDGALNHDGTTVGLYGTAPATQQTIAGSRGGNVALADLLTKLALTGIIVDGTSA
jgi:hypothetical protein